jgi:sortase A
VRIVVKEESLRSLRWILRWGHRTLFAGALSMLTYCGFVMIDAWVFQKAERRQLAQILADRRPSTVNITPVKLLPPAIDGLIGRIEIPRLSLSAIVVEGTGTKSLRRAVGHISGTGLPGQPGNVGISGHRDTFFRPLRNIQRNDVITLTTTLGEYRYRVVYTKIVSPHDMAVLDSSRDEILTLITCYPFYFVGAAPERFIVRAERVT